MLRVLNANVVSRYFVASWGNKSGLCRITAPLKSWPALPSSSANFSSGHSDFLQPWNPNSVDSLTCSSTLNHLTTYVPTRGMKVMGKVKRRCKDCELVWKDGILYNFCKTHPRHKQMLKPQYWENQRIITHASSGNKRPW